MILGANIHPLWADQSDPAVRADIRAKLKAMGVTSVRIDVGWKDVEPNRGQWSWGKVDGLVDECHNDGLSVLLMLYWAPQWSSGTSAKNGVPGDGADFGNAAGKVAQRYGSKLAALELWNEPDIDTFWAGTPQQFADMIADAYPVAKAAAPDTLFLGAAPTYLGLASGWFEAMYASGRYGDSRSHDAQAIHPYPSPSDLGPNAPASDWSINGIPDLQQLRAANGDTSDLWATEFGWSTHDSPDSAENWKRGVTETEQAAYMLGALILLEQYGVVHAAAYCDRDMINTEDPHERNFGFLRTDNSLKPVAQLLTAIHQAGPPEPPDPGTDDSDIETRVTALEARVTALEAQDAELSANFQEAADDLA